MSLFTIFIRLLFALMFGTLVGVDRQMRHKGAGIKTHSLVCIASAAVMLLSEYLASEYGSGDIARLGAQVISGVGFLGAGTIIIGKNKISGLTTAASIWACACFGLAIGVGFWQVALVGLILILFVFRSLRWIEDVVVRTSKCIDFHFKFKNDTEMAEFISNVRNINNIKILDIIIDEDDNDIILVSIVIKVNDYRDKEKINEKIKKLYKQGV